MAFNGWHDKKTAQRYCSQDEIKSYIGIDEGCEISFKPKIKQVSYAKSVYAECECHTGTEQQADGNEEPCKVIVLENYSAHGPQVNMRPISYTPTLYSYGYHPEYRGEPGLQRQAFPGAQFYTGEIR